MDAEHGDSAAGARIGMWLFVASEILFFGGLFLLYAMYRIQHPAEFHAAAGHLSLLAGGVNTGILITSCLMASLSVLALRLDRPRTSRILLVLTILLALAFLGVKAFEWVEKFRHGLFPGAAVLRSLSNGENLYFSLYFSMTGLHALHVVIGVGLLATVLVLMGKGRVNASRPVLFENIALYWNLVDLIWFFLFPLFYLVP